MLSAVKELYNARELVLSLTSRELKSKYRATTFGHLWSLANPLTVMAVYTVVFSYIMRIDPAPGDPSGLDSYALWLLCGLLPWMSFAGNINGGIGALIGGAGLIQKVALSRSALVVSNSLSLLVTWSIEMTVLVIALCIAGSNVLVFLPMVLVLMVMFWLFGTGAALILSVLNVYFRDTQHLVTVLLQVWFFLAPVLYPVLLVEVRSKSEGEFFGFLTIYRLYMLNPVSEFIVAFRNLLYDNRLPPLSCLLMCAIWGVATFIVGLAVFKRYEKNLAEAL
jgi:ABC-type polysaccharide/polyol phosphate export permease